jgi:hypothetical protein
MSEKEEYEKKLWDLGNDTVVRCPKCGRTQYLKFENGLRNGWSKCCGLTMPIVFLSKENLIEDAIGNIVKTSCEKLGVVWGVNKK